MIATELRSERNRSNPSNFSQPSFDAELPYECDFCGRAVHRETAAVHVQRTDDSIEVVVVCPECASTD
jgi:hypothetical protein